MAFILTVVYALGNKINNKTCGELANNGIQPLAAIAFNQLFLKLAMPVDSIGRHKNELRSDY